MKRGTLFLSVVFVFLGFVASPVFAQFPTFPPNQPQATPTPSQVSPTQTQNPQVPGRSTTPVQKPTHISTANCDVCGYCKGMTADQVPDRWRSCQQCVYPGFGEIDPLSNKTIQGTEAGIPTPDLFHINTDLGCISTQPGEFAAQISSFFFSIVGGIAFLFFIYGAGLIATSRSDPGRLNHGKRIIYGALVGLLFALFAVFIVGFVSTGIGLPQIGG